MSRIEWVCAVVAVIAVGLVVAYSVGSEGSFRPDGEPSDALFDWLVVQGVVGDGTPWDLKSDLNAAHYGADRFGNEATHPRTPGALLVQMPLALVAGEWALAAYQVLIVVSVAGLAWAAGTLFGFKPVWVAIVGAAVWVLGPVRWSLGVGSQGPIVAALIAVTWVMASKKDRPAAGVALGVASVLKAFPLLLIVMLWMSGRRRTAYGAAGAFTVLNLAGLLLPDVTVGGSLTSLMATGAREYLNNIGGQPEWMAVAVIAAAVWWSRGKRVDAVFAVGSAAMLVASPIVWHHYLAVMILPLASITATRLWVVPAVVALAWMFPASNMATRSTIYLWTVILAGAAGSIVAQLPDLAEPLESSADRNRAIQRR